MQWYEEWPELLKREQFEMKQRFPQLQYTTINGAAAWWGPVYIGESGREYRVLIACPERYPLSPPIVYPISGDSGDAARQAPQEMPDGSLCFAYAHFNAPHASVADVAAGAAHWIGSFESYLISGNWPPRNPDGYEIAARGRPLSRITEVTVINSPGTIVNLGRADIGQISEILIEVKSEIGRLIADRAKRLDLIEQIDELQRQAQSRQPRRAVIKSLLAAIQAGLSVSADTAQVWTTWGPAILRLFRL